MLKRYLSRPSPAVWVTGLLLLSLTLAGCGGAAETTSAVPPAPAETEEAVSTPPAVEEEPVGEATGEQPAKEKQEAVASEEPAATDEIETAQNENLSSPASDHVAECQTVDIPDNELIAAASDQDWSKGPANAPVTLIEYGDFQ